MQATHIQATNDRHSSFLFGASPKARELAALVARAASTDDTVLIHGETGTGKGLVAEAIHKASARAAGPFVTCDLRKSDPARIETELRDAFVRARGGSLLVDEIGELGDIAQQAVLSVLEQRRLDGGDGAAKDVRLLVATNRDLDSAVQAGTFRTELLQRFVQRIEVPTLRDRREDIPALAEHVVKDFAKAQGRPAPVIAGDAMAVLVQHDWPGNLRELTGALQRGMSLDPKAETLGKEFVRVGGSTRESGVRMMSPEWQTFKEAKDALLEDWEKDYLRRVLERSKGNMTLAARQAGIARGHLYRLMKKHGLAR